MRDEAAIVQPPRAGCASARARGVPPARTTKEKLHFTKLSFVKEKMSLNCLPSIISVPSNWSFINQTN
ncbi:hypothetical protein ACP70R_010567 [Stipagrostis hirtigluma subsp. patula]